MNFQMAAELAQMEGIRTECVVVKDDVAVPDSTYSAGRRGNSRDCAGSQNCRSSRRVGKESGRGQCDCRKGDCKSPVNGDGDVAPVS